MFFVFVDRSCLRARDPFTTLDAARKYRDEVIASCKRACVAVGGSYTIADGNGRAVETIRP